MLRTLLIFLSQAKWIQRLITGWSLAKRVSSRFVAGETLEETIKVIRELNQKGMYVTLDNLGEYTSSEAEARTAADAVVRNLDAIHDENLKSAVSLKLSQLGLLFDPALCAENLAYIVGYAKELDIFVRIDMEDSTVVEATLNLFYWLRDELGCENVGVVLQSYLYRSVTDTLKLMADGVRVRMTKGAYREPASVAYPSKRDVDENFDKLTDVLIAGALEDGSVMSRLDGRLPPIAAIASHDALRIDYAKIAAEEDGLPKEALEFQMLYGIRRKMQEKLVAEGYPVRIYVPYGTHWYPYFMRRLAERPANLWFFVSNLLRK